MAHPTAKDCISMSLCRGQDLWLTFCTVPMGWTSENVAGDFNISRERMDEFAAMSHQRAEIAQRNGLLAQEIVCSAFGSSSQY